MKLNEEFQIEYAKDCFANMHAISRFIDGKTAALTSLVVLVQGGMSYVINYTLKLDKPIFVGVDNLNCLELIALVLALLSFVASILAIIFCIMTNVARKKVTTKRTILFPVHVSRQGDLNKASSELLAMMQETDSRTVLEEYADQLANLGNIVARKGAWFNWAIYAFLVQSVFGLLALAFFLVNSSAR